MSAEITQDPAAAIERTVALYKFERTAGREELIGAYKNLLKVLDKRAGEHVAHGNRDLKKFTDNKVQSAMIDFDRFCQKWERSDERGLVY